MKILIISHSYYKYYNGGTEIQCKYIADYMIDVGYEVHYLFLYNKYLFEKDDNIYLHTIIRMNNFCEKMFGKIVYWFKVIKKLKKINPDVVYHRNLSNFALPVVGYCKINSECKSFLHLASDRDAKPINILNIHFIRKLIDFIGHSKIINKFDVIIGQTNHQNELLKKNYQRNCDVIISNMHYFPHLDIRKESDIKVIWISNWKKLKQPDKFIELAEKLINVNAKFIIIGRDPENEWSKALKSKINRLSNIEYVGELPIGKVNQILLESHILVNTSKYEGFPNTFIQAWMRKVPVVSLNVDPDDVLKTNRIGFHSKSFERMVEDVNVLINNKSLRDDMGNRAQKYAFENHSIKNINKLIQLIENDTK